MTGAYSRYVSSSSTGGANDDVLVTVEAAVAVLDAVYLKGADLYAKADATAEATMPVAGFIVSKPSATTALLRYAGDLGGFTLVADTEYYAAKVAGQITATPPAVAGNVVQGVGRAKNATTLTIAVQDDDYTVI
jgi:hypothetical protein